MKELEKSESIDRFFTRIVQMIPSHLYNHSNSEENQADNLDDLNQYVKHRKLPLSSDQRKAASKRKLKEKYQTTEELGTLRAELPAIDEEHRPEESTSRDLEELRKRLQARISGFKAERTSKKDRSHAEHIKKQKKKKSPSEKTIAPPSTSVDTHSAESACKDDKSELINEVVSVNGLNVDNNISSLQYNKILDTNTVSATTKKQIIPQGNKMQRLKRLLDETEKKRERLQDLGRKSKAARNTKNSSEEEIESAERASKKLKTELWNDMLKVAAGDKSVIVPTKESQQKLKKAMKRIERKKRKSADKWAERLDKVNESKSAKIKKREDNLAKKKMKKNGLIIDDKKKEDNSRSNSSADSTRPGFEGKKRGLLND